MRTKLKKKECFTQRHDELFVMPGLTRHPPFFAQEEKAGPGSRPGDGCSSVFSSCLRAFA
jgi:hypothetical protein